MRKWATKDGLLPGQNPAATHRNQAYVPKHISASPQDRTSKFMGNLWNPSARPDQNRLKESPPFVWDSLQRLAEVVNNAAL